MDDVSFSVSSMSPSRMADRISKIVSGFFKCLLMQASKLTVTGGSVTVLFNNKIWLKL